ncbi:uncharacterized protein LOC131029446 [Cryptomeria japonica]|uniref:uncharacterized protein LOC131029446 n=1 Tax=Cryptomeria japonica TaxID=3369 RepID=UPI0025ABA665|nr:uncharacterized protein LOC131029446 [Cryptomeria japonica]XP_057815918.1 uncharacterized protein LOC131029446 [Cryptomeria japonica]
MGIVRLRLARVGCTHRPFFRLVATDSAAKRDGRHLEKLGFYDPLVVKEKKKDKKKNKEKDKDDQKDKEKEMSINIERVKYWLSVGAQPTETVQHLLSKAGLSAMDRKGGQRNRYVIDPSTGRPVAPEKNQKNFSDIKDDFSVEQI